MIVGLVKDFYDIELIGLIVVAIFVAAMAIRRAYIAPPKPIGLRLVRYGKSVVGFAWAVLFGWLLFNLPIGDPTWFMQTFIWPGLFVTLCLTLAALIEC